MPDQTPRPDPESLLPLTHITYHLLLSLARGEKHGYGIIKDVAERTDGRLEIEAGTLYAAIKRMRDDGLIVEVEAPPEADARRRYYTVTPFGREVLRLESRRLESMVELAREAEILRPGP
ncbi:MAG TPA: PadR family transcriptional regulator [Longimicrobiales bacterium]|nr:PadR family transcriptional regulator [Longimicrobiales bacterium]